MDETRRKIGGADIAAVLGLSPWATASDVWLRIVEGKQTSVADIANHGLVLEPAILELAKHERPGEWELHPTLQHPDFDGGTGHLDAIRTDADGTRVVVDAKAIHWRARDKWRDEYGALCVPDYVRLQLDWYMQCAGTDRAEIAAFFGIGDFSIIPVEPLDPETRADILAKVKMFHVEHIVTKIPPAPDGSKAAGEIVAERIKRAPDVTAETTPALANACRAYRQVSAEITRLEKEKDLTRQEIMSALADRGAKRALGMGYSAKVTEVTTKKVNWEGLAKSLGATIEDGERFTVKNTYTKLDVRETK